VSANFHEFAFGLLYKDGYFYGTLATAINPGGASTKPQIPDRGKVLKINKETGTFEFIATGLRTPNGIGFGVDNEIFIADNQGDWLPSSKIIHLQPGAWYGSRSVDFEGTAGLTETQPVVWLPQDEIGNSPSQPAKLNVDPYKNQMIHGEVTHGGIKRVFAEKINGQYQGVVFRFTQGLEAGINRLIWGPDGSLYAGGVGSTGNWGHTGKLQFGLQRLTYNNKPAFEMLAVRARSNGLEIEFTQPLKEGTGTKASDYNVRQWYYKPTGDYGGPKLDDKSLSIRSVNVSADRKKVFLELGGMKPKHVVYIRLNRNTLTSASGLNLWSTEAWYTMNNIPSEPGLLSRK
jgi:cytochrome c